MPTVASLAPEGTTFRSSTGGRSASSTAATPRITSWRGFLRRRGAEVIHIGDNRNRPRNRRPARSNGAPRPARGVAITSYQGRANVEFPFQYIGDLLEGARREHRIFFGGGGRTILPTENLGAPTHTGIISIYSPDGRSRPALGCRAQLIQLMSPSPEVHFEPALPLRPRSLVAPSRPPRPSRAIPKRRRLPLPLVPCGAFLPPRRSHLRPRPRDPNADFAALITFRPENHPRAPSEPAPGASPFPRCAPSTGNRPFPQLRRSPAPAARASPRSVARFFVPGGFFFLIDYRNKTVRRVGLWGGGWG